MGNRISRFPDSPFQVLKIAASYVTTDASLSGTAQSVLIADHMPWFIGLCHEFPKFTLTSW
jgi:hypothetical protein